MKTSIAILLSFLFSLSVNAEENVDVPGKNISIEQLEGMFQNIKANTEWDTGGDLLWGYFFTHHDPSKLEEAKKVLVSNGYRFVDLYLSEKEDDNEPDLYWLHIEKVETHTPESLDLRNNEFYIFAHEFGLDTYDGMDVGPANK